MPTSVSNMAWCIYEIARQRDSFTTNNFCLSFNSLLRHANKLIHEFVKLSHTNSCWFLRGKDENNRFNRLQPAPTVLLSSKALENISSFSICCLIMLRKFAHFGDAVFKRFHFKGDLLAHLLQWKLWGLHILICRSQCYTILPDLW